MHPYTAHENDWLSGSDSATPAADILTDPTTPSSAPLHRQVPMIDDTVIRLHMRRGEKIRAQEVKRCFVALFRLPGNALRSVGAYLRPSTAGSQH